MSIFFPDFSFRRLNEIPDEFFSDRGIKVLAIDADNTLTGNNSPEVMPEIAAWLEKRRADGMKMIILSNNDTRRVQPFAADIGMEYIADAGKPGAKKLLAYLKESGVTVKETAVIGDQIFTDILCGRNAGCLTVLVEPMAMENYGRYIIKRFLEKPILFAYRKKLKKEGVI